MRTRYSTVLCLAAAAGLLFLSSCNDCTTSVAQFQNGEGDWTVYGTGDELRMADRIGLTDTVRIFTNTRTSSELVPGEGFNVADVCIEQYYTRRISVMQENRRPKPRLPALTVIAERRPDDIQVSLAIAGRGTLLIPDVNAPNHPSLPINGMTYNNVFEVTAPESTANGVRSIFFNREYGFLQVNFFSGRTLERIPNP